MADWGLYQNFIKKRVKLIKNILETLIVYHHLPQQFCFDTSWLVVLGIFSLCFQWKTIPGSVFDHHVLNEVRMGSPCFVIEAARKNREDMKCFSPGGVLWCSRHGISNGNQWEIPGEVLFSRELQPSIWWSPVFHIGESTEKSTGHDPFRS